MLEVHKRSRLPHWISTNATYFVTFNLFDAMPSELVERLQAERQIRIQELERLRGRATPAEIHAIDTILRERAEEVLDTNHGSCFMNRVDVAEVVANAITFFDDERYRLLSWCVMPNHAHAILHTTERLERIVHSWKSFSAKSANRLLRREGKFWQDDYYDRLIRNAEDLARKIQYVRDNPLKAGLVDSPWVA